MDTKNINNNQYVDGIKDKINGVSCGNNCYNGNNIGIDVDDKKILFEYGKSGIKIDRLKKSMKHNLNVLSTIDNIIKSFIDFNPKLKLNTILLKNKNDIDTEKNLF